MGIETKLVRNCARPHGASEEEPGVAAVAARGPVYHEFPAARAMADKTALHPTGGSRKARMLSRSVKVRRISLRFRRDLR